MLCQRPGARKAGQLAKRSLTCVLAWPSLLRDHHVGNHCLAGTPEKLEATRQQIPLGRLGTAEDCAGTFVYLASDEASGYVTGQVIEVNGGLFMG